MKQATIFAKLYKVDEAKHEVWGIATEESPDRENEIMAYNESKPYFQKWSDAAAKATDGKSLGAVRYMHQLDAVGKLINIQFDDPNKRINVGAKIVDESCWSKVVEGVLVGLSIGGKYVKTWQDKDKSDLTYFVVDPIEISLVDVPCLPTALFNSIKGSTVQLMKADGSVLTMPFAHRPNEDERFRAYSDFGQKFAAAFSELQKAVPVPTAAASATTTEPPCPACEQGDCLAHKSARDSIGRYTNQQQGELVDELANLGFKHTRTGSSATYGSGTSSDTAVYSHESGASMTVQTNGQWSYDDGHGRLTNGTDTQSMMQHCNALHGSKTKEKTTMATNPIATPAATTAIALSDADVRRIASEVLKGEKKTKRVAGEDLTADCFLIVGDPEDTSTWKLPWKFSTDKKTKSHLRNALARFDSMKDVSKEDKDKAWTKLVRLCKEYGIDVNEDQEKEAAWQAHLRKKASATVLELYKAFGQVRKSMYTVSQLAQMLAQVKYLQIDLLYEGQYEDDERDFEMAARFNQWLEEGLEILKDHLDEEADELLVMPAIKAVA